MPAVVVVVVLFTFESNDKTNNGSFSNVDTGEMRATGERDDGGTCINSRVGFN